MSNSKFRLIEKKWQKKWIDEKYYKVLQPGEPQFDPQKPTYYVLDMFPYPSGSGLHVGHASGYIGTDIIARKKRMDGYSVLHPMGWDAFGLPAEQYAIQTGQHPRQTTDINTSNFKKQLQNIGLSYDWDREIDTSHPNYYKWTQWIFLQLYKQGLVYKKEMPVWWCEELKTVLANEEVINGRSERGNYICERRPLTQWVFKITQYAEKLLNDLDLLDWPESVKKMQRDWIGRSEGAMIDFTTQDNQSVQVFSTRPDTLFGVVALVLAPEHPLVPFLTLNTHKDEVLKYQTQANQKSERDRKAEVQKITACPLGGVVKHPLSGESLPVYIADYVLADYGTGAVMAVPAHDERDFLFAKTMGLPIKKVIQNESSESLIQTESQAESVSCFTGEGILIHSDSYTGLTSQQAKSLIIKDLEKKQKGQFRVTYKIRDWIFSRQRYWGEPFPLLISDTGDIVLVDEINLPVELPPMIDFQPSPDGSSPLARVNEWVTVQTPEGKVYRRVTDTMPGWAGSCWYYLRFMDPHCQTAPWSHEAVKYWKQVDLYVGGASHAVMHLLYARFWHKVLFDIGLVVTPEPFKKLFNQGMVTAFAFRDETGRLVPSDEVQSTGTGWVRISDQKPVERFISKMAKSLRNVVNPDQVIEEKGCDALRLYQMFMGPLADDKPWDDVGLSGCENFLKKLWNFIFDENQNLKHLSANESPAIWKALHKALKRVNDSFDHFNFNTSVAAFMECLNDVKESESYFTSEQLLFLVKMMHPFIPHFTSEVWEKLGNKTKIDYEKWPELNMSFLVENTFELVLQVNGKIRKRKVVAIDLNEDAIFKIAEEELSEQLKGFSILKRIYVPKKLCNYVVKPQ